MSGSNRFFRRAFIDLLARSTGKKVFVVKEAGQKCQIFSLDDLEKIIEEKNTAREAVEAVIEKYLRYTNDDRAEFVWIVFEGFFEQFKQYTGKQEIVDISILLSRVSGFAEFAESKNPYSFFDLDEYRGEASSFEEAIAKLKTDKKGIICYNVNVKD